MAGPQSLPDWMAGAKPVNQEPSQLPDWMAGAKPVAEPAPAQPQAGTQDMPREGKPFFEWYLGPSYRQMRMTDGGGIIYKNDETGDMAYYSPTLETFDKRAIEQLALGADEQFVTRQLRGRQRGRAEYEENPPIAALRTYAAKIPVVGEFIDEMFKAVRTGIIGEEAAEEARKGYLGSIEAMREDMPLTSAGYEIAAAMSFMPKSLVDFLTGKGLGPLQRTVSVGARSAAVGATEEGASAAGREEGGLGERLGAVPMGAAVGGTIGGVTGALSEPVAAVAGNLTRFFQSKPHQEISRAFGISENAAKRLVNAFEFNDFAQARRLLDQAGETAMVADAALAASTLLDKVIVDGGNRAASVARTAIAPRLQTVENRLTNVMNTILGRPQTLPEIREQVQAGVRGPLKDLYEKALDTPLIFSASPNTGDPRIAQLYDRVRTQVEQSDIDAVNKFYRMSAADPNLIRRITRSIDENGNVNLSNLNVRDIDEITRQMQERAVKLHQEINPLAFGVSALESRNGRALEAQAQQLRAAAREVVPEYDEALKLSRSAIEERKAADLGAALLDPKTKIYQVVEALAEATDAEKAVMRAGLRSQVQDLVDNTKVTIANPNAEENALRTLWGRFMSPHAKIKVRELLGDVEADKIYEVLGEAQIAFDLKNQVVRGAQTAGRIEQEKIKQAINAPGIRDLLMEGRPGPATQRVWQTLTGRRPQDMARREQIVSNELVDVLTAIEGPDARRAVDMLERVIDGRQLTDAQAQDLANLIRRFVSPLVMTMPTVAQQTFRYNPETDDFDPE
jgi:hypothetical protein